MPLLRKVLLNLTFLALLLVAFYYYQTSNAGHWIISNPRARNASLSNLTSALAAVSYTADLNYSSSMSNILQQKHTNYYNIWCIFTKVTSNSPMRRKFQIFIDSLLRLTSVNIAFHVISDDDSQNIAQTLIQDVMTGTGKFMEVYIFLLLMICFSHELNYKALNIFSLLFCWYNNIDIKNI